VPAPKGIEAYGACSPPNLVLYAERRAASEAFANRRAIPMYGRTPTPKQEAKA
jgi:hypothetical protein